MKPHALILLLLSLLGADVNAQTPYDAFAPETSRPMLGLDAINMMEKPSQCNVINDSVWSTKSSADDVSKWLSVDPLSDKYPSISPYAYCNWNPVRYVDPDGEEITITGKGGVTVTYTSGEKYKGDDNFTRDNNLNLYNSYPLVRSNQTQSLIKQFYPTYP